MPRSGIRRVMDAAWASGRPFIGMHVGEPDFDPPAHVAAAGAQAYLDGDTHYVPNGGIPELTRALVEKLRTANGIEVAPEQVVVSAGGAQALHLALSMTLAAGEEVLVPDPGWPNYRMAVGLLQGVPVGYPLRPEQGFVPVVADLEALLTPRTRVLVVNSPSNPLGTVIPGPRLEELVRFAERHDLWLLSDECYDALTYGVAHVSPATFDRTGCVLSAFSFSKTYAMTGVRVGYLVCPASVAPVAAKLQEPMVACVNAPAQRAALAALTGPQERVHEMRGTYDARRRLALDLLEQAGIPHVVPHGAFYLWADVSARAGGDVESWAVRLLEQERVAVAPGTAFGAGGEGWVRLSLATSTDDIREGIAAIGRMA
ncbi:aminotransferase class I/II-fold pyridoxal phosphate-dependent enzyme [Phycicoccus endophyticus]|uniref:Aminotransferase class I/II-fold pyridoxal phosphate-dependent enzyme n=1 Tax=Phycicoccus endophyticus TaxID=1690220 RepID=A0A7G9R214_9MICO|nr:aminotransferase class I/II-fold pyridoxal phosphate-dependent enzyme [Phycicoccus endophyticus]NHI19726.1 aminotransferase class I/II-fold pyridoxal phosphate-dependent enzyme [Phycicoccus endophyticus]QNN49639.1 aminotransferase class I/II-fold pyridoxal phosphate-dependent enzyme [Phycicoccus endophyticus]